jgi:hypothetical protein
MSYAAQVGKRMTPQARVVDYADKKATTSVTF